MLRLLEFDVMRICIYFYFYKKLNIQYNINITSK
jgi:hypothetical protein